VLSAAGADDAQVANDMYSMFERLGEVERKSGSGMNVDWLSTHPASGTRVKVCFFLQRMCEYER
jgi:predicted Zn-dependent protease